MYLRQKKCGIWSVVTYVSRSKQVEVSTHTKDRVQAELTLKRMNAGMTFAQNIERYLLFSAVNHRPTTTSRVKYALRRFSRYVGAASAITDVTPEIIEAYKALRLKKISPYSVNSELRHLKMFYGWLERIQRSVDYNPVRRVKMIRIPQHETPIVSLADLQRLLLHAAEWSKPFIQFAFATGMRRNEIVFLRWENIDLRHRLAYVRNSKDFQTKSKQERAVPLNSLAFSALGEPRDKGWVFTRESVQIDSRRITEAFKNAVIAAGLMPGLHLHSLRHSFCTLLLANGASITDVATIAGHSTVAVTERYMHLKGETMHHATDLLTRTDRQ